jgi:hypothetical protein
MNAPLKPCWPEVNWRVLKEDADFVESVRVVVMRCCGFSFDAIHTDGQNENVYTCPLCEPEMEEQI